MNIDEARAILKAQDADTATSLRAIATWARFHGIASPKLLEVADDLEQTAAELAVSAPTEVKALPEPPK